MKLDTNLLCDQQSSICRASYPKTEYIPNDNFNSKFVLYVYPINCYTNLLRLMSLIATKVFNTSRGNLAKTISREN